MRDESAIYDVRSFNMGTAAQSFLISVRTLDVELAFTEYAVYNANAMRTILMGWVNVREIVRDITLRMSWDRRTKTRLIRLDFIICT